MGKAVFTLGDGTKVTTETEDEKEKRELSGFSVKEFVSGLERDLKNDRLVLPTLPTISIEALFVLNDSGSSSKDLAKVIAKDTSMTARLIRYANSPLYRIGSSVSSIQQAITCIGFNQVRHAIYTVSMREVFKTPHKAIQQRMDRLWEHSVTVGTLAVRYADKHHELDPKVALVAGLVHDVGKIPLLIKACDHPVLIEKEEYLDKLLHRLHTALGKAILKKWDFDPAIVAVAAEHEKLDRQPLEGIPDYADLVQVANILSYEGTDHPLAAIDKGGVGSFSRLGIDASQIDLSGEESRSGDIQDMFF